MWTSKVKAALEALEKKCDCEKIWIDDISYNPVDSTVDMSIGLNGESIVWKFNVLTNKLAPVRKSWKK